MLKVTEKSLDQKARRAAKRVGLRAGKSRWRLGSVDNYGGFQITDPYANRIKSGERWELSAKDVVDYCED